MTATFIVLYFKKDYIFARCSPFAFFLIRVAFGLLQFKSAILSGQWIINEFVICPNKLEWEPTCFGHFQPGIIYPYPWLWSSVDLLNWGPDRWFQYFQDSISNHFAHIANWPWKRVKSCYAALTSLHNCLLWRAWRNEVNREWCLKDNALEGRNVRDRLMIPDDITISDFECKSQRHSQCDNKNTDIQVTWFISHPVGFSNVESQKAYSIGWLPVIFDSAKSCHQWLSNGQRSS